MRKVTVKYQGNQKRVLLPSVGVVTRGETVKIPEKLAKTLPQEDWIIISERKKKR